MEYSGQKPLNLNLIESVDLIIPLQETQKVEKQEKQQLKEAIHQTQNVSHATGLATWFLPASSSRALFQKTERRPSSPCGPGVDPVLERPIAERNV